MVFKIEELRDEEEGIGFGRKAAVLTIESRFLRRLLLNFLINI